MLTVALTGSVASGKSTVGGIWKAAGIPVISADLLAREVVEKGSPGLSAVVDAFGTGVVDGAGALRRDLVRQLVFEDEDKKRVLESILHPLIWARRKRWMEEKRAEGRQLAVAEVPLLFEAGLESDFDLTVTVASSKTVCLRRLEETRGIPPDEAIRIWESQLEPAEKVARADFVIWNEGGLDDLKERALSLLDLLQALARKAQHT